MAKEMIISSNGFERRIAIIEEGNLTEFYVERAGENEGTVGNIYKGRVTKVLPGMQSAFVEIGLERDAFLYVSDVFEEEDIEFETPAIEVATGTVASRASGASSEPSIESEVEEILGRVVASKRSIPSSDELEPAPPSTEDDQSVEAFLQAAAKEYASSLRQPEFPTIELEAAAGNVTEIDLKDAIVEEKLIRAIHREEEEVVEEPSEVAGAGVRVGSLQVQFAAESKWRRIVDDEAPGSSAEGAPLETAKVAPVPEETPEASGPPDGQDSAEIPDPASNLRFGSEEEAISSRAEEAPDSDPLLPDGDASVRKRRSRGEFSTRRRVRRRRSAPGADRAGTSEAAEEPPAARVESRPPQPTITDLLKEGQEILVQIAKEPIGNKGARVTSHIALPGRYLVYMPTTDHIGVSRRIASPVERARLRRLAADLRTRQSLSGGFIVRTAAESSTEPDLSDDMQYLARAWADLRNRSEKSKAPQLVHRDLDLVQRILRDRLSGDFSAIRVDSEEDYAHIVDFVHHFQPKLLNRVKLHTRRAAIFEEYGVQAEIEKAIRPRVWLKSGGYIVINQTEALVAIDVNTGKFVGKTNRFEDTITRTNMEAAKEIARQVRLRDLGGIIVLDFIDMEERKNRLRVMQVLEDELRKDRAPTKILQFNDFGLVAITRKRVKQSLERTLCEPCVYCGGGGLVKSAETICYEILDEAKRLSGEIEKRADVILRVHPQVATALRDRHVRVMEAIESHLGPGITVKSDPLLHQAQFDFATN